MKILSDCVEDVQLTLEQSQDGETSKQGLEIVELLKKLQQDLKADGDVKLVENGLTEFESYNKVIKDQGPFTWLTGPWLFLENLLYRLINSYFVVRSGWFNYDLFARLKIKSFVDSIGGVEELASHYYRLSQQLSGPVDLETKKLLFKEFIEISLWGNATDLSLLATLSIEEIKSSQGVEARKAAEKNILSNDLDQVLSANPEFKFKRIDIVLDNSGFELYTDLAFALVMIELGAADQVVLHTKDIPWMVSDVNIKDFYILINELRDTKKFPNARKELDFIANKIEYFNNIGTIKLETNKFWTLDCDFYEINPNGQFGGDTVYNYLKDSSLVIFKGDMNYRKLTGDRRWKHTTKFADSIGPLSKHGLKILSLRTVKADVLVGLEEGVYEKVSEEWGKNNEVASGWVTSGKYAVISYSG